MNSNQFFIKKGPFPLNEIMKSIGCNSNIPENNSQIYGLESLDKAGNKDLTFLNSIKYKDISIKTKAVACITTSNLSKYFLPIITFFLVHFQNILVELLILIRLL